MADGVFGAIFVLWFVFPTQINLGQASDSEPEIGIWMQVIDWGNNSYIKEKKKATK